jgi:hypothetical protein
MVRELGCSNSSRMSSYDCSAQSRALRWISQIDWNLIQKAVATDLETLCPCSRNRNSSGHPAIRFVICSKSSSTSSRRILSVSPLGVWCWSRRRISRMCPKTECSDRWLKWNPKSRGATPLTSVKSGHISEAAENGGVCPGRQYGVPVIRQEFVISTLISNG